jgi:hypothetical protein
MVNVLIKKIFIVMEKLIYLLMMTLNISKSLAGVTHTVMRPITEEDEQNLDKWECINVDGKRIDKKDIYCRFINNIINISNISII